MHEAIYRRLIEVAKAERTTYYSEIAPMADLDMEYQADRNAIADILDEISRHERTEGRPLLSAVVVHKGEGTPGNGFFDMARSVGVMQRADDRVTFFARELGQVHDAWRTAKARQ